MKFIPTSEVVKVENYPYGFTLKTTLTDSIEFDKKKGYRHVTQTINPKNGLPNKPKKSTYSPLLIRYYNEDNHIKVIQFRINGAKEINEAINFISENFELFSKDEIVHLNIYILSAFKIDMVGYVQYCGAKFEDLKPLYEKQIKCLVDGSNNPTQNLFINAILDIEAIENCKVADYNPYR